MRRGLALLAAAVLLTSGARGAVAEPRIVAVTAAARDSLLVCRIETEGLPDPPSRETLESGLPSAIVLALAVLDPRGREVGGSRAEIRIDPDLWENRFILRTPLVERNAASLGEVERMLRRLPALPVLPLIRLEDATTYRVRARLAVYPLAPAAARASRERLTGDDPLRDPDRRERSVGVDALLRFFLGGGGEESWAAEAMSGFFSPPALPADDPDDGGAR